VARPFSRFRTNGVWASYDAHDQEIREADVERSSRRTLDYVHEITTVEHRRELQRMDVPAKHKILRLRYPALEKPRGNPPPLRILSHGLRAHRVQPPSVFVHQQKPKDRNTKGTGSWAVPFLSLTLAATL